jgi:hypothetical protein
MSLAIDPGMVKAVLLADGWHEVDDLDFELDSYEFVEPHPDPNRNGLVLHGGGNSGVCATGFRFQEVVYDPGEDGEVRYLCKIAGPLTAILAVRTYEERGQS